MIVIDFLVFLKFFLKEEGWENVIFYLELDFEFYVVDMLVFEIVNVIWKYVRKYGLIIEE